MDLMMRVWPAAVKRVHEEVADMQPFAKADGVATVEPWDYRYYQEKVRKAKYNLSEDEIKPYLEQSNLIKAMFWSAEQLYDLRFTENTGKVPVWQPPHVRGDQRHDWRTSSASSTSTPMAARARGRAPGRPVTAIHRACWATGEAGLEQQ